MKPNSFSALFSQRNSAVFGILLFSVLLIFLNGCTQLNSYYGEEGAETKSGNIIDGAALDANVCTSGECTCFVCKNDTPTEDLEFFNSAASWFFDYTLEEW